MAELKIKADSGGGTVSFKGPATTTSNAAVQLTLPVDDGTTGQYLKTDGSGALSWATVSSPVTALNNATANELVTVGSTTTELDAESGLTFDGTHLSITDGNLVIGTGGHGIDFSAQTATSAADSTTSHELFDHYEEGTWTPIPKISHVTTGITAAVSGAYTKIGRLVHISFKVNFSDKGSNGGQFTVHGLPFAENGAYISGSSTGGGGAVFYQQGMAGLTTDGEMTFRVESSMLYMQCLNSDNATVIPGGGELADDTHFYGHGTYYA